MFRKDKLSSSRIHYCYIIFSTEFKLSCWLCNLSSGLKEKNLQTKECKGKKRCLSFLPPWEFQTPLSLGTPGLLINLPRNRLSHSCLPIKEVQSEVRNIRGEVRCQSGIFRWNCGRHPSRAGSWWAIDAQGLASHPDSIALNTGDCYRPGRRQRRGWAG